MVQVRRGGILAPHVLRLKQWLPRMPSGETELRKSGSGPEDQWDLHMSLPGQARPDTVEVRHACTMYH
jgi:hypothetical protein